MHAGYWSLLAVCAAGCSLFPSLDSLADGAATDASTMPDASTGVTQPIGPVPPAGREWTLSFSDEFDDTPQMSGPNNGLQASKWNSGWFTTGITATSQPVQSSEAEWYGPEGITFPGDGSCRLHLFASYSSKYSKDYESGMITTATHFTFSASVTRSVIEARIRVPGPNAQAGGYWPTFWLLSHDNGPGGGSTWPPEIDLFEFFGNSNAPYAHLHTTGGDINKGFADSNGTVDLSLEFHVYTFEASASALIFYLDGAEQWREQDTSIIGRLLDYDPMYILLNMSFGGVAGATTGTVPADMGIDYIRVWQ